MRGRAPFDEIFGPKTYKSTHSHPNPDFFKKEPKMATSEDPESPKSTMSTLRAWGSE